MSKRDEAVPASESAPDATVAAFAADDADDDRELALAELGRTLDRRVRCLQIFCRCGLKVLRVERDNRDAGPPSSLFGALWTYGGLYVQEDGARNFTAYRAEPKAMVAGRTYSWTCPHGHTDSRRLERFLRAWPQHDPQVRHGRVIRLTLGLDV